MHAFTTHHGLVAPIDRSNVDTDAILPKQFMKSIHRTGFGPHLFDGLRYLDPGEPGQAALVRTPNPDFVLNQPRYRGASILLARENFGCGSSREHAPWAIEQFGFRVLIAPSFAEIFFGNCFKNGLLPIVLAEGDVDRLFRDVQALPGYALAIDLEAQSVTLPSGARLHFDIDAFRKHHLMQGLDEIGLTLEHSAEIREFEQRRLAAMPWLDTPPDERRGRG